MRNCMKLVPLHWTVQLCWRCNELSDTNPLRGTCSLFHCNISYLIKWFVFQIFRFPHINLNGKQFIVNATVFDLDPKPHLRHYSKYIQKTRDSYNAYRGSVKGDERIWQRSVLVKSLVYTTIIQLIIRII